LSRHFHLLGFDDHSHTGVALGQTSDLIAQTHNLFWKGAPASAARSREDMGSDDRNDDRAGDEPMNPARHPEVRIQPLVIHVGLNDAAPHRIRPAFDMMPL
jgi:hypothetical protein